MYTKVDIVFFICYYDNIITKRMWNEWKSNSKQMLKYLAKNISKSGYGENYETILKIMNKLSEDEIEILAYNCYRTAEKLGENAFELIEN